MERREDIRAAMHGLLSPTRRRDAPSVAASPAPSPPANCEPAATVALDARCLAVLRDIQAALAEYGVDAEPHEIAEVALAAACADPARCRALVARFLLGSEQA